MSRPCKDCGATPDVARFYAGVPQRCAECHKQSIRQNRAAKATYYQEFEAMRYVRDYEKRRALNAAYAQTERGKAAIRRGQLAYIARNPERRAAHISLGNALRDGRVIRPTECQDCGAMVRLQGHHDDYAKPLDVRWLCVPCHTKAHHGERAVSVTKKQQQGTSP